MEELSDIEARIDDEKTVLHKPRNHGFVALGDSFIYIFRDKPDEGFEFEEIHRNDVVSLRVEECSEYKDNTRFDSRDKTCKQNEEGVTYSKLSFALKHKVEIVTVVECPKEVTRQLLELDAF